MHILIAAHGFPPTHSAGAERRAERMARWLASEGHHIEVFAVESLNSPEFKIHTTLEDDYTVHRLSYNLGEGDSFQNLYDNPRIGQALKQILNRQAFDLVHVISGYLLGSQVVHLTQTLDLPIVITLTEFWFLCIRLNLLQATGDLCSGPDSDEKCARCLFESKRRYRLPAQYASQLADTFWTGARHLPFTTHMTNVIAKRRKTLQAALDSVDLVICPSQFLIDKFSEYGFNTADFSFMRQGLNIPPTLPPKSAHTETLRLVYVGQIQPHKGVDLLVDSAIRLLKQGYPVDLDLWGSESQSPKYTSTLKARSAPYPSIRWNGRYTGPKVWEVLAAADVLVIPSRWYENSPNVILEAFASGLPVVGTDLGGMAELIDHEQSGLLFELNNVDSLAQQLQRLLDEPNLLPQLREGIPPVKTLDDEMQEVMQHYQQLLDKRAVDEQPGPGPAN